MGIWVSNGYIGSNDHIPTVSTLVSYQDVADEANMS